LLFRSLESKRRLSEFWYWETSEDTDSKRAFSGDGFITKQSIVVTTFESLGMILQVVVLQK
jgi:hypothetical protein